jgi:hypothetical protein
MIPEFNEYGLLPEGEFRATREEIADRYLGNPNRALIWDKFEQFIKELKCQPWFNSGKAVWIDGGFTSDKATTKDIDVVVDISSLEGTDALIALNWLHMEWDRIMDTYCVDAYPFHPKINNNFRTFFTYVKADERIQRKLPEGARKGLILLEI